MDNVFLREVVNSNQDSSSNYLDRIGSKISMHWAANCIHRYTALSHG